MGRRRIGELNIRNFTGVEAPNSYLGALHDAIDIRELGIKLDVLGKRLVLISNQKDDECEEGDAAKTNAPVIIIQFRIIVPLPVCELFCSVVLQTLKGIECN